MNIYLCTWPAVKERFNEAQIEMFTRWHRAAEAKSTGHSGQEFSTTHTIDDFTFTIKTEEADPQYPNEVYIDIYSDAD